MPDRDTHLAMLRGRVTAGLVAVIAVHSLAGATPRSVDEAASSSLQAPQPSPTQATLTVLGASTQIVPAHGVLIGARFRMQPGWHIYWDGQNDSGIPPAFTFEAPAGWNVEALPWLPPERHVSSGDIVDFIYEGETTMLFKVMASPDAEIGTSVPIVVRSRWLVCNDACIPERGEAAWIFRIVSQEHQTPEEALARKQLMNVVASLPQRLDRLEHATVTTERAGVRIVVPGASHLEFFPSSRGTRVADLLGGLAADGSELLVRLNDTSHEPGPDAEQSLQQIVGLLRVRMKSRVATSVHDPSGAGEHWYLIDQPLTPLEDATAPPPSTPAK